MIGSPGITAVHARHGASNESRQASAWAPQTLWGLERCVGFAFWNRWVKCLDGGVMANAVEVGLGHVLRGFPLLEREAGSLRHLIR